MDKRQKGRSGRTHAEESTPDWERVCLKLARSPRVCVLSATAARALTQVLYKKQPYPDNYTPSSLLNKIESRQDAPKAGWMAWNTVRKFTTTVGLAVTTGAPRAPPPQRDSLCTASHNLLLLRFAVAVLFFACSMPDAPSPNLLLAGAVCSVVYMMALRPAKSVPKKWRYDVGDEFTFANLHS